VARQARAVKAPRRQSPGLLLRQRAARRLSGCRREADATPETVARPPRKTADMRRRAGVSAGLKLTRRMSLDDLV